MKKDDYQKFPKGTVIYKGKKHIFKIGDIISGRKIIGVKKDIIIPITNTNAKIIVIQCNNCKKINMISRISLIISKNENYKCVHCFQRYKIGCNDILYKTETNIIRCGDIFGDYTVIGYIKQTSYSNRDSYIKIKCNNCGHQRTICPANLLLKTRKHRCTKCNTNINIDMSTETHWRKLWAINVFYIYRAILELKLSITDKLPRGFCKEWASLYGVSRSTITNICYKTSWKWLTDQIDDGLTEKEVNENYSIAPVHPHLYTTHLDKEHAKINKLKNIILENSNNLNERMKEYINNINPSELVPPYDELPYKEILTLEKSKSELLESFIRKII